MINKKIFILLAAFCLSLGLKAQYANIDSATAAKTLTQLALLSKGSEFATAAQFIAYRGSDQSRAWKDVSNYTNTDEKVHVDEICSKINNSINQDSYIITGYSMKTESEGTWYILHAQYKFGDVKKNISFAFLKINNRMVLGDID